MIALPNLRHDRRGAAIIELALAAPILSLLVMSAIDVGGAFSRRLAIEQGAQRAVEKVMQTTEFASVQDTIADEVAVQADVDDDQVSVTFPRYCDDEVMDDSVKDENGFSTGADCDTGESERHYIMITVSEEYTPMFSVLGMGTKLANGNYQLTARAGMRTK